MEFASIGPKFVLRVGFVMLAVTWPAYSVAESRIAIVDVAFDTRQFLNEFKQRGIVAIGRYFTRCKQNELGLNSKRVLHQGKLSDPSSEISKLLETGFAILSVYQFSNNSAYKFKGRADPGKYFKASHPKVVY